MKKLFISAILLFISFFLFAEDWYRYTDLEDYLWNEWDVEIEVWAVEWDDGTITINLEDVVSEDWFDVRFQLSTILYALYDEATWQDMTYADLGIHLIIYSWFEYDDPRNPDARYDNEDLRWDIYLDEEWMTRYFTARRDRDRTTMVGRVVDVVVAQWEEANRSFLRRDLQQFDDEITTQQKLEAEAPRPPQKR